MKPLKDQSGFTLLEVMIALAILASMALAMFLATQQTLNSKQSTEDRDDATHAIVAALNRMSDDLDMAVMIKSKDLLGANFDGEYAFEGAEERLDFVTFSHQRFVSGSKESDVAEVSYYLVPMPDEPDKRILMRREATTVDKNLQEGGTAFPLLENVESLRFEYLDPKGEGEFKKTWDSKSIDFNNQLPQAVKITIEAFLPEEEQKSVFTTVAPVRLTTPLSF